MSFLQPVRDALNYPIQPLIEERWKEQRKNPVGPLGAVVMLVDSFAKVIPKIGIPNAPTVLELVNGSYFKPEKMYKVAETGLLGASGLGAVTTLSLLIAGLPGLSFITGLLTLGTLAGAYIARDAAIQRNLVNTAEELGRQVQAAERNNQELSSQLTQQRIIFNIQNAGFRSNITRLEAQNTDLRANIDRMMAEVSRFALENQHYHDIASGFERFVEQFRAGTIENQEEFARRLENFTQQISASEQLWRSFSNDASIFRANYSTQLGELRNLIGQITDPRSTLVRIEEHHRINEQIQNAVARLDQLQGELSNLNAQIALTNGQVIEREQLLTHLQLAHEEILSNYQNQTTALGAGNAALRTEIDRIRSLIDSRCDTPIEAI